MTFQEAQTKFSSIVGSVSPAMSSSDLVQKQRDLQRLLTSLPNTPEFDLIANAIAEFSPKLAGQVTQAVVTSLQSRDSTFKQASGLLNQVSINADADARTLSFEKPKLVVAALTESVTKLKEVRAAAKAGNIEEAASKVDLLLALVEQVRASIKPT
jgi:hypothetical protein